MARAAVNACTLGRAVAGDVEERLWRLGFGETDARRLADHFLDADARGKRGHGAARVDWLETLPDLRPDARPERIVAEPGFERWEAAGRSGTSPRGHRGGAARLTARTGAGRRRSGLLPDRLSRALGAAARGGRAGRLADRRPRRRVAHPDGGPPLAGTNPLAIAVPSSDGRPFVADVSMGKVTYGDVLTGEASPDDLVPFGGDQAHKAFALALGLQALVDALAGPEHGALLVVAAPGGDPVPALRARAGGLRLPGDR